MANLYLVYPTINNGYDSMVVCAKNEKEARKIDPSGFRIWRNDGWYFQNTDGREIKENHPFWVDDIQDLKVEKIGRADKGISLGIVLTSFNAG